MTSLFFPLPSPAIGGRRGGCEPRARPERVRRVAYYGPLAITYDCEDSPLDGERERDVLAVVLLPEAACGDTGPCGPVKSGADRRMNLALSALQAALHISFDELIENAPRREEAG